MRRLRVDRETDARDAAAFAAEPKYHCALEGRLAQRESTAFTRQGSLVRTQHRPPKFLPRLPRARIWRRRAVLGILMYPLCTFRFLRAARRRQLRTRETLKRNLTAAVSALRASPHGTHLRNPETKIPDR